MQRNCISTLQLHTYTVWCFGQITNWTQIHCRAVFALRLEWCQNFRQYIKGENRADFLYGPKMNLSVDTAQYEENINYWVGVRFVFFRKRRSPSRIYVYFCSCVFFCHSYLQHVLTKMTRSTTNCRYCQQMMFILHLLGRQDWSFSGGTTCVKFNVVAQHRDYGLESPDPSPAVTSGRQENKQNLWDTLSLWNCHVIYASTHLQHSIVLWVKLEWLVFHFSSCDQPLHVLSART